MPDQVESAILSAVNAMPGSRHVTLQALVPVLRSDGTKMSQSRVFVRLQVKKKKDGSVDIEEMVKEYNATRPKFVMAR